MGPGCQRKRRERGFNSARAWARCRLLPGPSGAELGYVTGMQARTCVRAMEIGARLGRRADHAAGPRARRRRKDGRCGAGPPAVLGQNGSAGEDGKRIFFWFLQTCSKFKLDLNSKPLNSNPTLGQTKMHRHECSNLVTKSYNKF